MGYPVTGDGCASVQSIDRQSDRQRRRPRNVPSDRNQVAATKPAPCCPPNIGRYGKHYADVEQQQMCGTEVVQEDSIKFPNIERMIATRAPVYVRQRNLLKFGICRRPEWAADQLATADLVERDLRVMRFRVTIWRKNSCRRCAGLPSRTACAGASAIRPACAPI